MGEETFLPGLPISSASRKSFEAEREALRRQLRGELAAIQANLATPEGVNWSRTPVEAALRPFPTPASVLSVFSLHPPLHALAHESQRRYLSTMRKPRVYVETTIPSFYHEPRTTPDIVARRAWTRLMERGNGAVQPCDKPCGTERTARRRGRTERGTVDPRPSPAHPANRTGHRGNHPGLYSPESNASRSCRRRLTPRAGFLSQMRFPRDLELPTPRQREQVRSHSPGEHHARSFRARTGDPIGIAWRRR